MIQPGGGRTRLCGAGEEGFSPPPHVLVDFDVEFTALKLESKAKK
jgi:hypothetical protein